jgi:hypothetical protein
LITVPQIMNYLQFERLKNADYVLKYANIAQWLVLQGTTITISFTQNIGYIQPCYSDINLSHKVSM